MKRIFSKNWIVILITLLGISVSLPLLRSGYFSHQDDLQVMRIFEMRKCFSDLQIPCRWVPDMGWGNGFPLFNYYGVFSYYVGGLVSYLVGYLVASKLLFTITLIIGSYGIYYLAKDLWGKYAGLTAAILYLFAPYKALDVYVRGALGESMALAIIPFVFYFGYRLINSKGDNEKENIKKNTIYFTLILFFFLITHNIMTVIFLPVLFLWLAYWLIVTKFKNAKLVLITLLFAFGLSGFFTVPAFLEKDLVQTESLTRFELDFRANFISIRQLFLDRVWGYGTSIPGPEGGMSFQVGWPHWILVLVAGIYLAFSFLKKRSNFLVSGIVFLFFLSVLMTHNKSSFIWEHVSILTYFQFPWRFLSLSILTASLLGGFVVTIVSEKYQKYLCLTIIVLTVVLNFNYFKPREHFDVTESQKLSGELWEQQRKGAMLDYLPKTALEPREGAPTEPIIISGKAETSNFVNKSNSWKFNAKVTEKTVLHIPVYYFPNWKVSVNGSEYTSSHDNLLGRISIVLEPGDYEVIGRFENTPIRTAANTISLVSILGFLGFLKWKKYRNL